MSVLPLQPWVNYARKAILWVGFGWPVMAVAASSVFSAPGRPQSDFAIIGLMFMAMFLLPAALVLALILPTHKARILVVPPLSFLFSWWAAKQSANYDGISLPLQFVLGIVTFTAITLLLPQLSTIVASFKRR